MSGCAGAHRHVWHSPLPHAIAAVPLLVEALASDLVRAAHSR